MGKEETGTLVNGPHGDTVDILLQNAPQEVLSSYPCLVLSGEVNLSGEEAARFRAYVAQGGTLMLNSAFTGQFPEFEFSGDARNAPETQSIGKGQVIHFGPDYSVQQLDALLREERAKRLPLRIAGEVQHLINVREDALLVTLVNNAGVTKAHRAKPVIDATQARTVTIVWTGEGQVASARELRRNQDLPLDAQGAFTVSIPPGEVVIVELRTPPRFPQ
jgi:hypothetical protein